jgi:hypothetical protein
MPVLPLSHLPPVVVLVSVMVAALHTELSPPMAAGVTDTVTALVTLQPVPNA